MEKVTRKMGLLLTITVVMFPAVSYPAYRLVLLNGNEITVSEWQEENGQIKFYASGGVIGIPKDTVRVILFYEIEPDTQTGHCRPSIASPIPPAAVYSISDRDSMKSQDRKSHRRFVKDMEIQKSKLKANHAEALERFRNAAQANDTTKKREALKELSKTSGMLVELDEGETAVNIEVSHD